MARKRSKSSKRSRARRRSDRKVRAVDQLCLADTGAFYDESESGFGIVLGRKFRGFSVVTGTNPARPGGKKFQLDTSIA